MKYLLSTNNKKEIAVNLAEKKALFNEANAFYNLAECGRQNIPEEKFIESYVPYIVNMSFAADLYLKLLLVDKGKTIKELKDLKHNLYNLYNELDPSQQESIAQSFKKPLIYSIKNELQQIKNAFPDWRYLVLDKANGAKKQLQFKPYFIKKFNEILREMCATIFNESESKQTSLNLLKHNKVPFSKVMKNIEKEH